MSYKKNDAIKLVKEQVGEISTAYQLVRMEDIEIVNDVNKSVLAAMLVDLNNFTNVSKKMNESQIAETVNMMIRQYPRMSFQEYQVFFNKIRSGKFGQLYESLDGIKIMAFLETFYKDLVNAYHEFKEEQHMQIKIREQHRDI